MKIIPAGTEADDIIYTPFVFWRAWVQQELPFARIGVLQELGNRMIALMAATGAGAIIIRLYGLKSGEESNP